MKTPDRTPKNYDLIDTDTNTVIKVSEINEHIARTQNTAFKTNMVNRLWVVTK